VDSMIYNPLEEFNGKYRELHSENTKKYFDDLVKRSAVDIEENRRTVKEYNDLGESLTKLKKKLGWWRFLRVLMCITLILIPLVIIKITPKIRAMREELEKGDQKRAELMTLMERQMAPLNTLFTDRDSLDIIEKTIPLISFASCFSVEQEANMTENFDFESSTDGDQSTIDVLAGHYNENPFVFECVLTHEMGVETYHGTKVIHWTESYRGSDGKMHTRTRSQTLHASLTKPKPFYSKKVLLNYCAQGGPELSFTRDATHLDRKSEKEIDRYVKRGEKKLKRLTDEAIKENRDFVSMSNSDFEVLFDALDRTNEVQFRTLFTPLAQTNMVDLIRSGVGYGDDFNFIKKNRTNKIITRHSQERGITVIPSEYASYSFDIIKEKFISKNVNYFKATYFDFAPLWAIPIYQERPVHSLDPIMDYSRKYSHREYEALSNKVDLEYIADPRTKTNAIFKSTFIASKDGVDEIAVTAYSYDIISRIDFVPVYGGDGRWHNVPVPWDDYIPLKALNNFFVATSDLANGRNIMARRKNICIFK